MQEYDFSKLSLEEKLRMSEALWASIDADSIPIPQWHLDILEERLEKDAPRPPQAEDWREILKQLTAKA